MPYAMLCVTMLMLSYVNLCYAMMKLCHGDAMLRSGMLCCALLDRDIPYEGYLVEMSRLMRSEVLCSHTPSMISLLDCFHTIVMTYELTWITKHITCVDSRFQAKDTWCRPERILDPILSTFGLHAKPWYSLVVDRTACKKRPAYWMLYCLHTLSWNCSKLSKTCTSEPWN